MSTGPSLLDKRFPVPISMNKNYSNHQTLNTTPNQNTLSKQDKPENPQSKSYSNENQQRKFADQFQNSGLNGMYLKKFKLLSELSKKREDCVVKLTQSKPQCDLYERSYTTWDYVLEEIKLAAFSLHQDKKYKIAVSYHLSKSCSKMVRKIRNYSDTVHTLHKIIASGISSLVEEHFAEKTIGYFTKENNDTNRFINGDENQNHGDLIDLDTLKEYDEPLLSQNETIFFPVRETAMEIEQNIPLNQNDLNQKTSPLTKFMISMKWENDIQKIIGTPLKVDLKKNLEDLQKLMQKWNKNPIKQFMRTSTLFNGSPQFGSRDMTRASELSLARSISTFDNRVLNPINQPSLPSLAHSASQYGSTNPNNGINNNNSTPIKEKKERVKQNTIFKNGKETFTQNIFMNKNFQKEDFLTYCFDDSSTSDLINVYFKNLSETSDNFPKIFDEVPVLCFPDPAKEYKYKEIRGDANSTNLCCVYPLDYSVEEFYKEVTEFHDNIYHITKREQNNNEIYFDANYVNGNDYCVIYDHNQHEFNMMKEPSLPSKTLLQIKNNEFIQYYIHKYFKSFGNNWKLVADALNSTFLCQNYFLNEEKTRELWVASQIQRRNGFIDTSPQMACQLLSFNQIIKTSSFIKQDFEYLNGAPKKLVKTNPSNSNIIPDKFYVSLLEPKAFTDKILKMLTDTISDLSETTKFLSVMDITKEENNQKFHDKKIKPEKLGDNDTFSHLYKIHKEHKDQKKDQIHLTQTPQKKKKS